MTVDQYDFCIVGAKCYGYLAESDTRYIGGIERDLVALARVLAERYTVAFVTYAEPGTKPFKTAAGIDVFPAYDPNAGIPKIRLVYPRLTSTLSLLKRLRPKVVIQEGAADITFLAWYSAQAVGAKFVFLVGSDGDCNAELTSLDSRVEKFLFKYAIRRAHKVMSQTDSQVDMLQTLGLQDVGVLRIPSLDFGMHKRAQTEPLLDNVLWVGRPVGVKRPEWIVQAAQQMPELQFRVVGESNNHDPAEVALIEQAEGLNNLALLGARRDEELGQTYRDASVLLSTSIIEGFPRVFLEAWSTGLPVWTSFDPDGVVSTNKLGVSYHSVAELVASLRSVSQSELDEYARNARRYYEDHYSIDACRSAVMQTLVPMLGAG